jgi:hypothetical protein
MTEKELLAQLNNLKNIKLDNEWKRNNRDILLAQISAGNYSRAEEKITKWAAWLNIFSYAKNFVSQPVAVVTLILCALFGSGVASIYAARSSKPGDSLYIAKIISEKAQLAVTFGEENKAKLGLEFASNRAKEMTQVLNEEGNSENKKEQTAKLENDFRNEIKVAKNRLKKMNIIKEGNGAADKEIFSANLGREDKGTQVYDQNGGVEEKEEIKTDNKPTAATSTAKEEVKKEADGIKSVLDQAEKMFEEKNYGGTVNKLEEAGKIINREVIDNKGEVKGEGEKAATSTENN